MTTVADHRRRITLPKPFGRGDVFAVEVQGDNQVVLTRLDKPSRSAIRLQRRGGFLVAVGARRISQAETRRLLDEFP
jgi:hypothetical protein